MGQYGSTIGFFRKLPEGGVREAYGAFASYETKTAIEVDSGGENKTEWFLLDSRFDHGIDLDVSFPDRQKELQKAALEKLSREEIAALGIDMEDYE
jgi:kynurenine formamidase